MHVESTGGEEGMGGGPRTHLFRKDGVGLSCQAGVKKLCGPRWSSQQVTQFLQYEPITTVCYCLHK